MKKLFLLLLMVLILSFSIFADYNTSTIELGSSFAFGKDIDGFVKGITLESKTLFYSDNGFGLGTALSANAPIVQFKAGKAIESNNPITLGFALYPSYNFILSNSFSIATNIGAELAVGRKRITSFEFSTYMVNIIGDISFSYHFTEVSSIRLGVKGQLPVWGRFVVRTLGTNTYTDSPINIGNYVITPYIGYSFNF